MRERQQLMSDAQIVDATRAYQVKAAFALAKAKYDNDLLLRSAPQSQGRIEIPKHIKGSSHHPLLAVLSLLMS